ncbi:MAG TPA: hypothetical protein VIE63_18015 [Ramlibacter sp.]
MTALLLGGVAPSAVWAHGFVGQRFFPATIATDDPFVADELSLPTFTTSRFNAGDDSPAGRETSLSVDFSKRITQNFGLEFGSARERFTYGNAQPAISGRDNLDVGAKYLFYKNEASESLMSAGVVWEVGGTGSKSVADSFSTYTPTFYFGKGFGNLKSDFLRPLAVTGTVGVAMPGRASEPHTLKVGLAFEYSLPYLQSAVKDIGLGAPFNRMVPVVEIAAAKPIDRVDDRRWTGTVNPGVLWPGRFVQLGIEAVVPINRASGHGVGVQAQLHFFLDDLFPRTIGKPLLGS